MKAPSSWEVQLPAASLPSRKLRPLNSLPSPLSPYKVCRDKGPAAPETGLLRTKTPLLGLGNLPGISKLAHSESKLPGNQLLQRRTSSLLLSILTRAERGCFTMKSDETRRWRAGHRRNHTTQLRPPETLTTWKQPRSLHCPKDGRKTLGNARQWALRGLVGRLLTRWLGVSKYGVQTRPETVYWTRALPFHFRALPATRCPRVLGPLQHPLPASCWDPAAPTACASQNSRQKRRQVPEVCSAGQSLAIRFCLPNKVSLTCRVSHCHW